MSACRLRDADGTKRRAGRVLWEKDVPAADENDFEAGIRGERLGYVAVSF